MSRGGRPTVPEFGATVLAPRRESRSDVRVDEEPASGVVLKREMLTRVPRLAVSTRELMAMPLDHRAGFIASFVDGTFTVEMILDACAMPADEALALLGELAARGVIVLS
jgi:hypothetical protein